MVGHSDRTALSELLPHCRSTTRNPEFQPSQLDECFGDYALINAPEPITTMCKDGFIASIPSLYVFLIDKGDKAGAHQYNRVLARA
jgi:hypothetical protein